MRTKTPQRADRILDAAVRLFASHRFHEVRMDDIAAEAAVSKGTLYSYFHDKDELYQALLERGSRGMTRALKTAVASATGAEAKLMGLVNAIITYFDAEPHLFDLIQVVEVLRRGERFHWQEARDVAVRLLHAAFDEGRKRGEFTVRDPELAGLMLFGGLRSVLRFGSRPRPRRLAERVVNAVLHGAAE